MTILSGGCIILCLHFASYFSLLSQSTILHYVMPPGSRFMAPLQVYYFNRGAVYFKSQIRFLTGLHIAYIILKYCLILFQYIHMFFINLLNWDDVFFPRSVIHWSSEENIPIWFLYNLFLEDNHRIICTNLFYLDKRNGAVLYPINVFRLGPRKDLVRWNKYLGVGGKVRRNYEE